ncbi:MAG: hypothetical protein IKV03_01330 [Alphaproteobacteria bacterium]|nr:hypothetical protein [Alphaproteobacteria bacterium]
MNNKTELLDEKSFFTKYNKKPQILRNKKENIRPNETIEDMFPENFLLNVAFFPIMPWELLSDTAYLSQKLVKDTKNNYMEFIEGKEQHKRKNAQSAIAQHDTQILKEKKLSLIELNKMKHKFLQSNKALNKQIAEAAPDLPRDEKGSIELDKCTTEQKKTIVKTVETFINKNPEYKQMIKEILKRKVSTDEIKRDAAGLSATFPMTQLKHKNSSSR